jgi:hypothetical protein
VDISGSRAIERAFVLARLGRGPGAVLDIGPGPKAKLCGAALALGFDDVVAVDLEPMQEGYPKVIYSTKGDRKIEWGYVKEKLPPGEGFVLDIGPAPANPKPASIAADRGWDVVGVGLEPPTKFTHKKFRFYHEDFLKINLACRFDWVLNISTIEHFGLAGRYGVTEQDDDADLRGMAKARTLMKSHGRMLLTVPVGQDAVMSFRHRVYGVERLPRLLDGYVVVEAAYYAKTGGVDEYVPVAPDAALAVVPTLEPETYYGLGCFVLGVV